jgi:hypothetical protein
MLCTKNVNYQWLVEGIGLMSQRLAACQIAGQREFPVTRQASRLPGSGPQVQQTGAHEGRPMVIERSHQSLLYTFGKDINVVYIHYFIQFDASTERVPLEECEALLWRALLAGVSCVAMQGLMG